MSEKTVQKLSKYEIIREIGRSNDIVYEAYDPQLKRRVAIKELVIPPGLSGEKAVERRERFYREARAAGSLQHPNIVTIYEVGEENGRHYMVMELLEGQNLREILQVKGVLSLDEALNITEQVLNALIVAHSHGVIHRDIKPENIHILPSGIVKLTDFGIARITFEPSLTMEGEVFGTPSYMSPEQIKGLSLDGRSDLFSLGVVMYEMLSGKKPFTGDSPVTITYNILSQQPEPIPGLPLPVWEVIRKALEKNPENRFRDAEEMLNSLKKAKELSSPNVSRVTTPPPSVPAPSTPAPSAPAPLPSVADEPTTHLPPRRRLIHLSESQKNFLILILITLIGTGTLFLFIFGAQMMVERWQIVERRNKAIEFYNKALEYYQSGDYASALNYTNQSILYDGDLLPARLLRGNIFSFYKQYDLALQEWQYVVSAKPMSQEAEIAKRDMAGVYLLMGVEAYRRGDTRGARNYWYMALTISPGSEAAIKAEEFLNQILPTFP
jgi:serine/threonine protein kinase